MEQNENTCENFKHFRQHYIKEEEGASRIIIQKIHAGHCAKPRLRNKSPQDTACERFEEKENSLNERKNPEA